MLIQLADYYDVSVDYLIGRTDDQIDIENKKTPTNNVVDVNFFDYDYIYKIVYMAADSSELLCKRVNDIDDLSCKYVSILDVKLPAVAEIIKKQHTSI